MSFVDSKRQKGLDTANHHYGISKDYNFIFNSVNAGYINDARNQIIVNFTNTIDFPADASGVKVGLHSANIYNNVPNVVTGLYDTLEFIVAGGTQTITLAQGSYSACDLQTAINNALATAYPGINPAPTVTFIEVPGEQRLEIQFNSDNMQINWLNSNLGYVLGFDKVVTEPTLPQPAPFSIFGNVTARLNWALSNFLVLAPDLVGDGIPLNATGRGIVGGVPIIAAPGSLIAYEAQNILWNQCDSLIGNSISSTLIKITNERLEDITLTEEWNVVIIVRIEY